MTRGPPSSIYRWGRGVWLLEMNEISQEVAKLNVKNLPGEVFTQQILLKEDDNAKPYILIMIKLINLLLIIVFSVCVLLDR